MQFPVTTLVVPLDLSEQSLAAFETARGLCATTDGLHVIHVLAPIIPMDPMAVWGTLDDTSRVQHVRDFLKNTLAQRGVHDATIHVVVSGSNPAHAIVDLAESVKAALIVTPSHGRTGLARLALGSVAEHVVRLASCPVLVLRR